jgi:rubrerythrin
VSAAETSRRDALRHAALGAGAVAAAGMLRPAGAAAQSPSDEDLRDFLGEAIALEQITVLAYARAADADAVDQGLAQTLNTFRDHEQAHANALRTALDSLGFDAPSAPDAPDDTGVFDDVDGIEAEAAEELTDLLTEMEGLTKTGEWLTYLGKLEREQLSYYVENAPALDSEDLATTGAEIAGCQAQHLQVLGAERGDDPARAAEDAAAAAAAPERSATGE